MKFISLAAAFGAFWADSVLGGGGLFFIIGIINLALFVVHVYAESEVRK